MICIPATHPDLEEFIDVKLDLNKITKANISIQMTDDFMSKVAQSMELGKPVTHILTFDIDGEEFTKEVDALRLFNKIAENNWRMGEPKLQSGLVKPL